MRTAEDFLSRNIFRKIARMRRYLFNGIFLCPKKGNLRIKKKNRFKHTAIVVNKRNKKFDFKTIQKFKQKSC
jgi:hypothetical protein